MQWQERIRIGFVTPSITSSGGGVAEAVRVSKKALLSAGAFELEIFTLREGSIGSVTEDFCGATIRAYDRLGPSNFGFSIGLVCALLSARVDILHVHGVWGFHCLAALLWHLKTGKPVVVSPHGMLDEWIRKRSPYKKWLVSLLYQSALLRRAVAIQALTEKEQDDIRDVTDNTAIEVIPNCVSDAPTEEQDRRPEWWSDEYQGKTVFMFFGRIHEKKGCLELCEAWRRRCTANPRFAEKSLLVFCGWNDGLANFEIGIAELKRTFGNVLFAGPQYGVEKWRSLFVATFIVLPSKSEGLPMAVLEAWSCAVPVLMTRKCNLAVGFESRAALVIGGDVESIERGLNEASRMNTLEHRAMSQAAKELACNSFSCISVGKRLAKMYINLLGVDQDRYPLC